MTYEVELDGVVRLIEVERREQGWSVSVDGGPPHLWMGQPVGAAEWMFRTADVHQRVGVLLEGNAVHITTGGHAMSGTIVNPRRSAFVVAEPVDKRHLVTQMPGVVVRLLVEEGQPIHAGQVLVVVEAMKMENEFKASVSGVVKSVHVEVGQALDAGTHLVTLDPEAE